MRVRLKGSLDARSVATRSAASSGRLSLSTGGRGRTAASDAGKQAARRCIYAEPSIYRRRCHCASSRFICYASGPLARESTRSRGTTAGLAVRPACVIVIVTADGSRASASSPKATISRTNSYGCRSRMPVTYLASVTAITPSSNSSAPCSAGLASSARKAYVCATACSSATSAVTTTSARTTPRSCTHTCINKESANTCHDTNLLNGRPTQLRENGL